MPQHNVEVADEVAELEITDADFAACVGRAPTAPMCSTLFPECPRAR
jgi:hypothetical protein